MLKVNEIKLVLLVAVNIFATNIDVSSLALCIVTTPHPVVLLPVSVHEFNHVNCDTEFRSDLLI